MKKGLTFALAFPLMGWAGSFARKGFPQFAACKSATQAYKANNKGTPPTSMDESMREVSEAPIRFAQGASIVEPHAERSPAQTLKIWQAPYEDDHGDLIGSSTVFAEIEPRRWRIGENQGPVPRRLAPLQVTSPRGPQSQQISEDRGGFPLFPTSNGPRRLNVEEVDYREP